MSTTIAHWLAEPISPYESSCAELVAHADPKKGRPHPTPNAASPVPLKEMLHLKSGLSYLEQDNLLISGEFLNHQAFEKFRKIIVDPEESYAANSLWINSTVLVPAGFPRTLSKIKQAGYHTITLDVSEFRKLDGGLSCLSLRF